MPEMHAGDSIVINDSVTGPDDPKEKEKQEGDDLILGKFKSQEDLIKAYRELEGKLGSGTTEEPAQETSEEDDEPDENATEDTDEDAEDADQRFTIGGQDVTAYAKEFEEKGELSEESYAALSEMGFPKEVVDAYVKSVSGEADSLVSEMVGMVGGDDAYDAMAEWARNNMKPSELDAYEKAVQSGNRETTRFAVETVWNRYRNAVGDDPELVGGEPARAGGETYRSMDEMKKAMRDPRYGKDPVYTKEVEQKVVRSRLMSRRRG